MVGSAASMRWVLVMAPVFLSCGTLKSTRMSTRLPLRESLSMESLAMGEFLQEMRDRSDDRVVGGAENPGQPQSDKRQPTLRNAA